MVKMKIRYLILWVLLLLTLSIVGQAQENSSAGAPAQWTRIKSSDGEFSIETPNDLVYFYDEDGFIISPPDKKSQLYTDVRLLNSSIDKTFMSVEMYKISSQKGALANLIEQDGLKTSKILGDQKDFIAKQAELNSPPWPASDGTAEISYVVQYFASATHLYVVTVSNRGKKTAAAERFLASVRLQKSGSDNPDLHDATDISRLKPLSIGDLISTDSALNQSPAKKDETGSPPAKKPQPIVLVRPTPSYSESARKKDITGVMRVRVEFSRTGAVSKVVILSLLPEDLGKNCFFAALRMKFLPAEKEGSTITISKVVEYNFNIY
jgi:hypothetical protein